MYIVKLKFYCFTKVCGSKIELQIMKYKKSLPQLIRHDCCKTEAKHYIIHRKQFAVFLIPSINLCEERNKNSIELEAIESKWLTNSAICN